MSLSEIQIVKQIEEHRLSENPHWTRGRVTCVALAAILGLAAAGFATAHLVGVSLPSSPLLSYSLLGAGTLGITAALCAALIKKTSIYSPSRYPHYFEKRVKNKNQLEEAMIFIDRYAHEKQEQEQLSSTLNRLYTTYYPMLKHKTGIEDSFDREFQEITERAALFLDTFKVQRNTQKYLVKQGAAALLNTELGKLEALCVTRYANHEILLKRLPQPKPIPSHWTKSRVTTVALLAILSLIAIGCATVQLSGISLFPHTVGLVTHSLLPSVISYTLLGIGGIGLFSIALLRPRKPPLPSPKHFEIRTSGLSEAEFKQLLTDRQMQMNALIATLNASDQYESKLKEYHQFTALRKYSLYPEFQKLTEEASELIFIHQAQAGQKRYLVDTQAGTIELSKKLHGFNERCKQKFDVTTNI